MFILNLCLNCFACLTLQSYKERKPCTILIFRDFILKKSACLTYFKVLFSCKTTNITKSILNNYDKTQCCWYLVFLSPACHNIVWTFRTECRHGTKYVVISIKKYVKILWKSGSLLAVSLSALYKMASFALQKRLSYTVEQCLLHCKTMAFEAQSGFCRFASELFLQDDFGKTLN